MKEEMQPQNKSKLALLLIAPVLAAIVLLLLRPSQNEPVVEPKPAPVAIKEEPKQPEPPPVEEDVSATRDALLGLNKQPEPAPVEEKRVVQRAKRRVVEETTVEEEEDLNFAGGDGLSDSKFRSTIESWAGMRGCVRSSKTRAADSTGALKMSLTIATSGDVVDSRVFEESNDAARVVAKCVQKQVRTLKFPAFAASETRVTKEAKFVF